MLAPPHEATALHIVQCNCHAVSLPPCDLARIWLLERVDNIPCHCSLAV